MSTAVDESRDGLEVPTGLFIGGRWEAMVDAVIPVEDPATGEPFIEVADASPADGLRAVDAAAASLDHWRATAPRDRGEILRRAFELMQRHRESLARLIVRENGKVLSDALAEVDYAADFLRWYSEEAVRVDGEIRRSPTGANHIMVLRQPLGVSLLVTPWNFPAAMATRKIAPALAAGCTTVLKPAASTPLTALALAKLLEEAGTPPGVVNVVPSTRTPKLVDAVLHDNRVRKLSFTGSTEVGRSLLAAAADRVLRVSLELGGNAPFVVFDDADLDAAVEGAVTAKMRNGGEACTAANRFFVHKSVETVFVEKLSAALGSLRVGPGLDPRSQVGPLIDSGSRERMTFLVEDAVDRGARVCTGGRALDGAGWFYSPTVLAGVEQESVVLEQEIFGPVAPVATFERLDDVVERSNETEHGLVAYVYSRSLHRALEYAEAVEAGMVGINRPVVSDPAAPFGGMKQSGLGREGGHDGLLAFTEQKYVAVDW